MKALAFIVFAFQLLTTACAPIDENSIVVDEPDLEDPLHQTRLDVLRHAASDTVESNRNKRDLGDRWDSADITYNIVDFPPGVDPTAIKGVFYKAFGQWREATAMTTGMTFKPTTEAEAQLKIRFSPTAEHDERCKKQFDSMESSGMAHAFYPQNGEIHFNMNRRWLPGTKLASVALHEIGHAIGLPHNQKEPSSIMYEAYSEDGSIITDADKEKLKKLYETERQRSPPTSAPSTMAPRTSTTSATRRRTQSTVGKLTVTPRVKKTWQNKFGVDESDIDLDFVNNSPNTVTSASFRITGATFVKMWNMEKIADTEDVYKAYRWFKVTANGGTNSDCGFVASGQFTVSIIAFE